MDCLDILTKAPAYRGKITGIISRNVVHFFTPEKAMSFFSIIDALLSHGGQAHICGDTPAADSKIIEIYDVNVAETGNIFPGFITAIGRGLQTKVGIVELNITNACAAADGAECGTTNNQGSKECFVRIRGEVMPATEFVQTTTVNYFTPEIFRRVIARFPDLEIVDTYLMTQDGLRMADEGLTAKANTAAVVVRKRA